MNPELFLQISVCLLSKSDKLTNRKYLENDSGFVDSGLVISFYDQANYMISMFEFAGQGGLNFLLNIFI